MALMISVVLATYNGEKYIQEQLESIFTQVRKPDEVLIYDDCSEDQTTSIVRNYIETRNLHNWKLIRNDKNLGWKENFMTGLLSATGDIIFPCDQDDIWENDKISSMLSVMQDNDNILLLASNYNAFYDNINNDTKVNSHGMSKNGTIEKYIFNSHFMEVKRPGCCYAVRKKLISKANEIWQKDIAHDACLWRIAEIEDGLYLYNKITMRYRRHSSNQTGANNRKNSNLDKILVQIDNMLIALKKIEQYAVAHGNKYVTSKTLVIKQAEEYLLNRWCYLKTRNIYKCILCWFKYKQYYPSFKTLFGDMFVIISKK